MYRLSLALVVLLPLAFSQTAPQSGSSAAEKKASIEGVVVNSITKAPLRRAQIGMYKTGKAGMAGGDNAAYSVVTDAEGKFRIENLDPGEYVINCQKQGFVSGRGTFGYSERILKLSAADAVTNLRYALVPQGIVTGRVLDDEGEPVQGANVILIQQRRIQGVLRHVNAGGTAQTNDRGEYRIVDVQPGKYYLGADIQRFGPGLGASAQAPQPGAPRTAIVATYYPSASDLAQATRIEIQPGLELGGQDITLRKEKVVKVTGKVLEADGSPVRQAYVSFMAEEGRFLGFMGGSGAATDEKGNFTASNIRPGQYIVFANKMDGQVREVGVASATVGETDTANVVVQLAPMQEIKGSFALEGSDRKDFDFSTFYVRLTSVSPGAFGGMGGRTKSDGTFALMQAQAGRYQIYVRSVSTEAYVKSIQAGGEDVYGKEVDLSALASGFRIVLRLDPGNVKGTVEVPDELKAEMKSPAVILVPADARLRNGSTIRITQMDQNNGFDAKGVRPGDYLAFAFGDSDSESFEDAEFLAAVESQATKVSVGANESKTLSLKLLKWPAAFADRLE